MLVYILQFYKVMNQYFRLVIHPRRLIVASEKKVMQFTISVPLQLFLLLVILGGVFWSSYATGRLIATNSTLQAQSNTIRSVASVHINNIFRPLPSTSVLPKGDMLNTVSVDSFMFPGQKSERMALLEQQVAELKNINEAIVDRVRMKTDGQIENLESIVGQTGINPLSIKKQVEKIQKSTRKNDEAEGGPYIPANVSQFSDDTADMLNSLDELQNLRKVVAVLPLGLPIKNAEERSHFGHRIDPFNGEMAFHAGLDLAASLGASIYSTADGTVITAQREGSYGNVVDIDHGFGIITRYGHLNEINVNKGDRIKRGDIIGVQGSTGRSTGAHLHYEVRYNGRALDPDNFLQTGRLLELGSVVSQD